MWQIHHRIIPSWPKGAFFRGLIVPEKSSVWKYKPGGESRDTSLRLLWTSGLQGSSSKTQTQKGRTTAFLCQINGNLATGVIQWPYTHSSLLFPMLAHLIAARLQVQPVCRSALRTKCALQACTTLQGRGWHVRCSCLRLNSGRYLVRVAAKVKIQRARWLTNPFTKCSEFFS